VGFGPSPRNKAFWFFFRPGEMGCGKGPAIKKKGQPWPCRRTPDPEIPCLDSEIALFPPRWDGLTVCNGTPGMKRSRPGPPIAD